MWNRISGKNYQRKNAAIYFQITRNMTAIYMQDKRYSDIIQFINNLNFEPLKKLKKLKAAKWPLAIHSLEINSNERYGFKSSPPETTVTVISYVTDATCIEVNFQSFAGKNTISYNHIQTAAKFCRPIVTGKQIGRAHV